MHLHYHATTQDLASKSGFNSISDAARWTESVGLYGLSVFDHLIPFPARLPVSTPVLDPWVTLSACAAATERLHLTTLVINGSLVHPARLSKTVATLVHLAGNRFTLGLGAGGYGPDEAALQVKFAGNAERRQRLEELICFTQALWQDPPNAFAGQYYATTELGIEPRPAPPPPLLLGGASDAILELVAKYADACNFMFQTGTTLEHEMIRLDAALTAHDRPRSSIKLTLLERILLRPGMDDAEAAFAAMGAPQFPNGTRGMVGTPDTVAEQLTQFSNAGVSDLYLMFADQTSRELFAQTLLGQQ